MTTKIHGFRRKAYAIVAVITAFAVGTVGLTPKFVSAAQLTTRSIKLSNSTPGATGVTYTVTFDTGATAAQELIVDFCGTSPIVNANCDFDSTSVPDVSGGASSAGTFAAVGSGSPVHTVKVVGLTIAANSTFTIDLTNITNPSTASPTTASFFARILTFQTGNASVYAPANTTGGAVTTGTYVDYGGIALTTTTQVLITAKVQESLTFCASAADLSGASANTCASASPPTIEIGHGTPKTLDSSAIDIATVYTQMSTNASLGATVRMKATNACANGGLSSTGGAVCNIPGTLGGGDGSAPLAITAGTASFGLFVSTSALTASTPTSTGTVTPDNNYNDGINTTETGAGLTYGMDQTASGVGGLYGDTIMSCGTPISQVNNHLVFGATASLTTQAGIYTGNEILIATGKF